MKVVADLHLHSKYSRAVSQQMVLPEMAKWAKRKGIDLLGTGDFTHPLWFRELKSQLEPSGEGVYKLKMKPFDSLSATLGTGAQGKEETLFLCTTEISSIYSQGGKVRRIHTVIFAPSLEIVEKINQELLRRGANLMADGRPIIGLSARDLAELVFSISEENLVIPAHAWTPWFSLYGSESGFDSINECFIDSARNIMAIETGLSSNPAMNWQIAELDKRSIVSFSDAHSPAKLGREATVFELGQDQKLSYQMIRKALIKTGHFDQEMLPKIACTYEFYPEEGKYHYTGHRNCQVRQSPQETKSQGSTCPVCGKGLTVGVMHRVEELASHDPKIQEVSDNLGVLWFKNGIANRPPYAMLVPLMEIIAESLKSLPSSQRVINEYNNLTDRLGSEFRVLLNAPTEEISKVAGKVIAEGVDRVRRGKIAVEPGYDGVFGVVKIWGYHDADSDKPEQKKDQLSLF